MATHLARRPAYTAFVACAVLSTACGNLPTDASGRTLTPPTARTAEAPAGLEAAPSDAPTEAVAAGKVARVVVTFISGGVERSTWSIEGGEKQQFGVLAYDSAGRAVGGRAGRYESTNPTAFSIDSLTGLGTAVGPGSVAIRVNVDGIWGRTGTFKVIASTTPQPQPEPQPAPPPTSQAPSAPSAGAIPVQVVRFDGKSGAATVTAGVPLVPGALRPGQEGYVRVFVNGVEQQVYAAGLHTRHPDGSLRAVLVQFRLASLAAATPATGVLDLSTPRTTAMTLATPISAPGTAASGAPRGVPQAAILPTDASYLVRTDLVGPTVTSAATTALGGAFARYESDFKTYSSRFWSTEGADWAAANYYDRALIYAAWWVRTGNPTYWSRAAQLAYDYRTDYLVPANYGSSPHWSQLEGVEKHYVMTGDEASRMAVVRTAGRFSGYVTTSYLSALNGEGRIAARVLHSQLLAWRLSPVGSPLVSGDAGTINWGANVELAISRLVDWQKADGSYPSTNAVCGGQLNYMIGQLNDALIKTHSYYVPTGTSRSTVQATIKTLVTRGVDYMWNTQWIATKRAFKYASVPCTSDVGGMGAAPDLNNLISTGFGWVYKQTGDAKYRTAGEAIFAGGVTQAYLEGSKQFNENYTSSFVYLGYR